MLVQLVSVVVCIVGLSHAQICPNDWEPFEQRCYQFNIYPVETLDHATLHCQSNGAILLSVETRTERDFITNRIHNIDTLRQTWYTSGQRDTSRTDRYVWTSTNTEVDVFAIGLKDRFTPRTRDILGFVHDPETHEYVIDTISDRTIMRPFICEISNSEVYRINIESRDFSFGVPYTDANLVPRGPKFIVEATSTVVITDRASGAIDMECFAYGVPQPDYAWYRNMSSGNLLLTTLVDSRYTITNGKLTILNPLASKDTGYYHCQVQNSQGMIRSAPSQLSFASLGNFNNIVTAPVRPMSYEGAVIECPPISSTLNRAVVYAWRKSETNDWRAEKTDIRPELNKHIFVSGNGRLYFSEVTSVDDGFYFCIVTLTLQNINQNVISTHGAPSRTSNAVQLKVSSSGSGNYQPKIVDSFINVVPGTPVVGMNITLECFAYGTMELFYSWHVPRFVSDRFTYLDNNRQLRIMNVQLDDTGVYNCRVENDKGHSDEKNFTLYVESKPRFVMELTDQHLDVGTQQLTWRCEARAIPFPTYTWYKNGVKMTNGSSSDVTILDNTLYLRNLNPARDNGMYQCMAENAHGIASTSAQLRILSLAPTFGKFPLSPTMSGAVGGDVYMECRPEAAPYPDIQWFRNGGNLNPSENSEDRMYMTRSGDLVIQQLSMSDQGTYECVATNELGEDRNRTILRLYDETVISTQPQSKTIAVNSTGVLQCRASYNRNNLDIVYEWEFNGKRIDFDTSDHHRKDPVEEGRLYVIFAQYEQSGMYTCVATTQVDTARYSAYLTVTGPPTEPAGVVAYRPAEHESLEGIETTSKDIILRWTDPKDDRGADLSHYNIYGKTNYSDKWQLLESYIPIQMTVISGVVANVDSHRRQYIIRNLKPGVSYQFKVRCINRFGIGDESKPTASKTIPGAPPNKYPNNIGGGGGAVGTLRITWERLAPEDAGGYGLKYDVEYRQRPPPGQEDGNFKWFQLTTSGERMEEQVSSIDDNLAEVSVTVGSDNYYLEYQVRVTPVNDFGIGPTGQNDSVMSAEAMPNGIPTNTYAEPFNESAIIVYWDPIQDTREFVKGKLKGYKILYWLKDIEDESDSLQLIVYGNVDHGMIIGLRPDTWYTVVVMVFNGAGNGVIGEVAHQSTDRSAPLEYPVNIEIYPHSDSSVRVRFRGVNTKVNEEPLLGYKIRYWEDSNDIRNAKDIDCEKNTEGIIYGIQTQTLYHLRVLGYSVGGDGKMSSPETLFSFMRNQVSMVMVDPSTSEVRYVLHDVDDASSVITASLFTIAIATIFYLLV